MRKLANHGVALILNRAVEGGGVHAIEKDTEISRSQVWEVLKDFPLWDFVRKPEKYKVE